jgi:hypothetical protein
MLLLKQLRKEGYEVFRHGDCIRSDAQAHDLAIEAGFAVVIHPPSNPKKRAWKKADSVRPPKPYLERNWDIVNESQFLIATPRTMEEELRSGTWATIRYARKKGIKYLILEP